MNYVEVIKKAALEISQFAYDGSWLPQDVSKSFLICLGAGPWKEQRRYNVQRLALMCYQTFSCSDLSEFPFTNIVYPLDWQNDYLCNMLTSLNKFRKRFDEICDRWKEDKSAWEISLHELFDMCKCNSRKGSKVLWMFARDSLNIPAFPIDRWVRRKLNELRLPEDPWYITKLCLEADVDPNSLNRSFFLSKNPDWSLA